MMSKFMTTSLISQNRPYSAGSVVLIILNLNTFNSSIILNDQALVSSRRDVYWLTPPEGIQNILSKYALLYLLTIVKPHTLSFIQSYRQVTLNGKLLELVNNLDIPDLNPEEKEADKEIELPTLSFGFQVFKDAKAKGCIKSN